MSHLQIGEAHPYVYQNGYNVSTYGACNGSIILDVKGGVTPYTYLWKPGQQTIANPSNLCSNENQVIVTDANGCAIANGIGLNELKEMTGP
ncbi:MAG: SprB repeat-containing protein [Bacteroidetes bacterium]|nr:SprB repeat-containing protein [Bacteroidota bacterium]